MSIFEESLTGDTTAQETNQSYLEQLIRTKGENWKDPEVLAKGKLESDTYIQSLESQLNELRTDLSKQDYAAQLIQELRGKATDSSTVNPALSNSDNADTDVSGTPTGLSEVDLKSLVEKTLKEKEQDSLLQQNRKFVEEVMTKQFGTEAQSMVNKRAKELGMSLEELQSLASKSPNAFMSLMGQNAKSLEPMINSSIRTESVTSQASSDRDWNYYQKLRRENRNLYYQPKIQRQMMEDKARLGDRFGI
jgi:hypothetical protein